MSLDNSSDYVHRKPSNTDLRMLDTPLLTWADAVRFGDLTRHLEKFKPKLRTLCKGLSNSNMV